MCHLLFLSCSVLFQKVDIPVLHQFVHNSYTLFQFAHGQHICHILGDLAASFEGRNEYISRLCSYPLLILDDFGMERGTEYGLEQVYSVIDSRYRSGKPLIATTNLTLEELQHPQDTPHARIYDRLTSMCAPVRFTGSNFRKETAQEKLERLKQLMKQRKESL